MLAYVFWHAPRFGVDVDAYEYRLVEFQRVMRSEPPEGFLECSTHRLAGVPWLDGPLAYEDWYLVADFAALGTLNEAAVAGVRRAPHDDVAAHAAHGVAGLYARWFGHPAPDASLDVRHRWFAKPDGLGYEDLRAELVHVVPEGAVVWQRQLVLGPTPEFCLAELEPVALPWPTVDVQATRLMGT